MKIDEYSLKWKTVLLVSEVCGVLLLLLAFFNNLLEIAAFGAIAMVALLTSAIDESFVKEIFCKKNMLVGAAIEAFLTFTHFVYVFYLYNPFTINRANGSVTTMIFTYIVSVILFVLAVPAYSFVAIYVSDNYTSVLKEKAYNFLLGNRFCYICYAIAIISVLVQIRYAFSLDIIPDEAFSLALIRHSYGDVIKLTAQDVHPPFFYIILKACVDAVGLIFPNFNKIYLAKLASIVPYLIIMLICNTKVKKIWGDSIAALCMLCVVGFPNVLNSILEIRMYGWGLLFVFSSFLEFYLVIKDEQKEDWLLFMLYSLLAAYTHYFACVSVALFYVIALVYFLSKKNVKQIKNWFLTAFLTVLLYLPWFIVLIIQMIIIKNSYWINKLNMNDIKFFFTYAYTGKPMIMLAIALVLNITIKCFKRDTDSKEALLAFVALGTTLWTMLVGVVVSLLYRPIFVDRYMIPSLLCTWLGFLLFAGLTKKKFWQIFMALHFCCISIFGIYSFDKEEHRYLKEAQELTKFIGEITNDKNVVFVTDVPHAYGVLPALSDAETYVFLKAKSDNTIEKSTLLSINISELVFGDEKLGVVFSESDVLSFLNENKDVYLVKYSIDLLDGGVDINDTDILNYEYVSMHRLGYMDMNFYKVTAQNDDCGDNS